MIPQALFHIGFVSKIQLVVTQQADPSWQKIFQQSVQTKRQNLFAPDLLQVPTHSQPLLLLV